MGVNYKDWEKFDDGNEKAGIEGYYKDMERYRFIYVMPTNSKADWVSNFFKWRFLTGPTIPPKYWFYNQTWYNEGLWLKENICKGKKTVIIAYSSGYPRALYTYPSRIHGIAGASQGFGLQGDFGNRSLIWKKGDVVPFIPFSKIETKHIVLGKWQPIWKAHAWTSEEINLQIDTILLEYGIVVDEEGALAFLKSLV